MGAYSGPEISNEGLVFHFDMNNTDKSWKGKPTTNLIASPEINNTGWGFGIPTNGTDIITSVSYLEDEGGPFVRFSSEVIADRSNTWPYMRSPQFTTGSGTFTWSGYYRVQELASGTSTAAFRASAVENDYGSSGLVTKGIFSSEVDGNWRRFSLTRTLNSATTYTTGGIARTYSPRFEFYYGAMNVTGEKLVIDFKNLQVEQSNFVTPFVNGTRSSTEAIKDLTTNSIIEPVTLSYNSNNTFEFDGVDDYLQTTTINIDAVSNNFTIDGWFYTTSTVSQNILTPSSNGIDNWVECLNNELRFFYTQVADTNNRSITSSGGKAPANQWNHFAVSIVNDTAYMWINGEFITSSTETFTIGTWRSIWNIGQRGNSTKWFQGEISKIRVYNRKLSSAEVKNNYLASKSLYGL